MRVTGTNDGVKKTRAMFIFTSASNVYKQLATGKSAEKRSLDQAKTRTLGNAVRYASDRKRKANVAPEKAEENTLRATGKKQKVETEDIARSMRSEGIKNNTNYN